MCESRTSPDQNTIHFIKMYTFFISFHSFPESLTFTLGVHSVQHEINFWTEKSRKSSAKSDKETANAFAVAIDKLNQLLRNVATISSLEEFLDTVHTHLDELWRLPQNYPQTRMTDMLDIICELKNFLNAGASPY